MSPTLTRAPSISLRYTIPAIFVTLIVVVTGLTGWLAFRSGQQAVNDLATQLSQKAAARIKEHVRAYLETPRLFHQMNVAAVRAGSLDVEDFPGLERYFWQQVQLTDVVPFIYYGNERGEFIGVQREERGTFAVWILEQTTAPQLEVYRLDGAVFVENWRDTAELIESVEFDPRVRPWYQAAVQAGGPTWSPIYPDIARPILIITSVMPVHDEGGALRGVLGIELSLEQVSDFVRDLELGRSGQAFIVGGSGEIVASSAAEPPFVVTDEGQERLNAMDSSDPLIRATARRVHDISGGFDRVEDGQQFVFELKGARQFVQVTPLDGGRGPDWLVVVVIPEADFMGPIYANVRFTVLLGALILALAVFVGLVTGRWIIKPVLAVTDAAAAIEAETFEVGELESVAKRTDELGRLARVFQRMARDVSSRERRLNLLRTIIPIGVSLSAEKNFDRLMEMILLEAKSVCNADSGTLYLRTEDELVFFIVRNDSLDLAMGGTTGRAITFPSLPLYDRDGQPNHHNIATYTALENTAVNIPDAYQAEGFDFSGTRAFDQRTGYRSASFLTIPLTGSEDEVIGVLQLINAQDPDSGEIVPFEKDHVIDSLILLASAALRGYLREQELRQEIQQLRIQVDEEERQKQVDEIVETDFFQELQAKARAMRRGQDSQEEDGSGDSPEATTDGGEDMSETV